MPRKMNPNSLKNIEAHKCSYNSYEIASKSQRASVKKRKENKQIRDVLKAMLDTEITDKNGKKMTAREGIAHKLIAQALNGNTRAFELIRDTIGEKPVEKYSVETVDEETINEVEELINRITKENRNND